MAIPLSLLDWTHIQSFCAVAKEGSLSAAARKTAQSQPTVGRHIKSIEAALGVELFQRSPFGLVLTDTGVEILPIAQEMQDAAARLQLTAAGQSDNSRGTVRITASVVFSHFILPPIIAEIRTTLPEIDIELVPSDKTENLLFREADIAVRLYRPKQLDVITKHITDFAIGLYASTAFLDRVGRPESVPDMLEVDFVGLDKDDLLIRAMRDLGLDVDREFFPVRCDDQAAHWHLVCAGAGIGAAQTIIGDAEPRVEKIPTDFQLPVLPVWLTAPEALRSNPRIRRVWDFLSVALKSLSDT